MRPALLFVVFALGGCVSYSPPRAAENPAPVLRPTGEVCLPTLPRVNVVKTVSAAQIELYIRKEFPYAELEQTADDRYAILDHDSVMDVIGYIPLFTEALGEGFGFVHEAWDCDNYAKLLSQGFQLALMRTYGNSMPAQTLVAVIYVDQESEWGGVPAGGAHALNAVAVSRYGKLDIIIIEPQGGDWSPWGYYPNKPYRIKVE